MNSQRRQVPTAVLLELLRMQDESPHIRAAMDARFAGVFTDELELTMRGGARNPTVDYLVEHHMRAECFKIDRLFSGWGLCVFRFVQRLAPNSEPRKAKYARLLNKPRDDPALQFVLDVVPVVPAPTSFSLFQYVDDEDRDAFAAEATDGKVEMFVVRSLRVGGPQLVDDVQQLIVSSDMGSLLYEWRTLKRLRGMAENALDNAACPPILLEQVPPTAYNVDALDNQRRTAMEAFRAAGGELGGHVASSYTEPDARDTVVRRRPVAELHQLIDAGRRPDPADMIVTLPRYTRVSASVPAPELEAPLAMREANWMATVAAIIRVPPSYLGGVQRTSAINDKQSTMASDVDKDRYMQGVVGAQRDLMHFFKTVFALLGERNVEVHLPISSRATLEQLQLLHDTGAISRRTYNEHAVRNAGMHPNLALFV